MKFTECPTCKSQEVEQQAESGEWWWHCYSCGVDFE